MVGKLAIGILVAICFYVIGTSPDTHVLAKNSDSTVILEEKMSIDTSPKETPLTEPLTPSDKTVTEVEQELVQQSVPINPPISTPQKTNEQIIIERLFAEGFTREQVAGIMGNLQQEHNFQTGDVPGGLGIAQWMGNRRANLMARENYLDINVQLDFMMEEFRTTENAAYNSILRNNSVEGATIAFQNGYERCGNCKQAQRIQYAYAWLGRL